jgi:hypothetical protein
MGPHPWATLGGFFLLPLWSAHTGSVGSGVVRGCGADDGQDGGGSSGSHRREVRGEGWEESAAEIIGYAFFSYQGPSLAEGQ